MLDRCKKIPLSSFKFCFTIDLSWDWVRAFANICEKRRFFLQFFFISSKLLFLWLMWSSHCEHSLIIRVIFFFCFEIQWIFLWLFTNLAKNWDDFSHNWQMSLFACRRKQTRKKMQQQPQPVKWQAQLYSCNYRKNNNFISIFFRLLWMAGNFPDTHILFNHINLLHFQSYAKKKKLKKMSIVFHSQKRTMNGGKK